MELKTGRKIDFENVFRVIDKTLKLCKIDTVIEKDGFGQRRKIDKSDKVLIIVVENAALDKRNLLKIKSNNRQRSIIQLKLKNKISGL